MNQISKFVERLNNRGYSIEAIHKAISQAGILLQQKMKFRKVLIRTQYDNISNQNKNNKKILFFRRIYHPNSLPNKTLQATYTNSLGCIKTFDNKIVCNKRPKNIRDILMPSSLKNINSKTPSDFLQEVSNYVETREETPIQSTNSRAFTNKNHKIIKDIQIHIYVPSFLNRKLGSQSRTGKLL